jgi:predicted small lipoprotein YifL
MKLRNTAVVVLVALSVIGAIGGCGKKGDPVLPDGKKDQYPASYPQSTDPQTGVFSN